MAQTTLDLIRHASTAWNVERRIQGQKDTSLTAKGRAMAKDWGRRLQGQGYTHILCSDLQRAVQSATLINESLGLPMQMDPQLREQNWGEWTGCTAKELHAMVKEVRAEESKGFHFCPPGGETRLQVLQRATASLQNAAKEHAHAHLLVVTHNGVLRVLAYHLLSMNYTPDEQCPIHKEYALHRVVWDGENLRVATLNRKF